VHNSSTGCGLSSVLPTPDGGQPGFIAEARGTSHATTDAPSPASVTSTPASASAPPSQNSKAQTENQSKRPFFKVEKFDGSTSLDTYLWTFHQLAEYMQWGEDDKFINLCTSLDGAAKQVLREMPTGGTTEELQKLLQTRFGTAKQAVSFEAQLHARRRKPKEPLQDLHQDISRLVQLAHPTESGSFLSHVGIRAFTRALDNSDLEFEILKTEPKTLPDAVNETMRLESLAESVRARARTAASEASSRIGNARHILAIAGEKEVNDASADLL